MWKSVQNTENFSGMLVGRIEPWLRQDSRLLWQFMHMGVLRSRKLLYFHKDRFEIYNFKYFATIIYFYFTEFPNPADQLNSFKHPLPQLTLMVIYSLTIVKFYIICFFISSIEFIIMIFWTYLIITGFLYVFTHMKINDSNFVLCICLMRTICLAIILSFMWTVSSAVIVCFMRTVC
jgi:hypothetical protein